MATIQSDQDLKLVLERLSLEQKRRVSGMFIESALERKPRLEGHQAGPQRQEG